MRSGLRGAVLSVAALVVLGGCAHGSQAASLQMPLRWSPTNSAAVDSAALSAFQGQTVAVVAGQDERGATPEKIGENREEAASKPVTTKDDVPAFVRAQIAAVLRQNAVDVVPSGASRVLRVDLKDFFVDEVNTYQGRVIFAVTLEDGHGKTLWHGVAKGTNSRWGRSFDEMNYQQTLSDSTLDAVSNLLSNPELQLAIRGH